MNELRGKIKDIVNEVRDGRIGHDIASDDLLSLFTSEWERMVKESKPKNYSVEFESGRTMKAKLHTDQVDILDQYESNLTQNLAKLMEGEE